MLEAQAVVGCMWSSKHTGSSCSSPLQLLRPSTWQPMRSGGPFLGGHRAEAAAPDCNMRWWPH